MNREDRVALVIVLVVAALIPLWVYSTNAALMAPHEEDLWIQKCYRTTDWASGVDLTQIVTRNSGILYYAGHYDFNSGNYTIYSEGKPGWLYREITSFELATN